MRLDKFLCDCNVGTRTEVKRLIKSGAVSCNGVYVKTPDYQVNPDKDSVKIKGETIQYQKYLYYLLNKPAGVVTAVTDIIHPTVMSCLGDENIKDCFPVGRLDIDTEGLLLITNDGELAHRLLSPKRHVEKTYYAVLDDECPNTAIDMFKVGIDIGDDKPTLPAKLVIEQNPREVRLTITEGRFHQVKRMFKAIDREVKYLKRETMGSLNLGSLETGKYRVISPEEISKII